MTEPTTEKNTTRITIEIDLGEPIAIHFDNGNLFISDKYKIGQTFITASGHWIATKKNLVLMIPIESIFYMELAFEENLPSPKNYTTDKTPHWKINNSKAAG